ncbi:MAG: lipid A deacylase LpxR family protein [Chitinophagaceae bacterium]
MKPRSCTGLVLVVFFATRAPIVFSQQDSSFRSAFHFYWDNDFINLRMHGSDEAYTNGMKLEYLETIPRNPRFFLNRFFIRAGNNAINTSSWSVMQVMYSPSDIRRQIPDSTDYPYSGGLFTTHFVHSTDSKQKFSLQTGITLGVMGPPSLAGPTQVAVHRAIKNLEPKGWDYQLKKDFLFNLSFTAEKMLRQYGRAFELIGGANAQAGTMFNALTAYFLIRAGKMNPYFNGLIGQVNTMKHSKKFYVNVVASPSAQVVFYNSLVDGGLLRRWAGRELAPTKRRTLSMTEFNLGINYGFTVAWKRVGVAILQQMLIPTTIDLPDHEVGNVTLSLAF